VQKKRLNHVFTLEKFIIPYSPANRLRAISCAIACIRANSDQAEPSPSQRRANNPNRPLRVSRRPFPGSDPSHRPLLPRAKSRSFRSFCRAWRVHRLGFHFVLSPFSWRCLGNMTPATRPCEYKVSTALRSWASDKRVPLAPGMRFLPTTIANRPRSVSFFEGSFKQNGGVDNELERSTHARYISKFTAMINICRNAQSFVQADCYSGNIYYVRVCSSIYARNIYV